MIKNSFETLTQVKDRWFRENKALYLNSSEIKANLYCDQDTADIIQYL